MSEIPGRRGSTNSELALTSFRYALNEWKRASVPSEVLMKPLVELRFHDDLSRYLRDYANIKTGYALRTADIDILVAHLRKEILQERIVGGHLILFAGNLRAYLKTLSR